MSCHTTGTGSIRGADLRVGKWLSAEELTVKVMCWDGGKDLSRSRGEERERETHTHRETQRETDRQTEGHKERQRQIEIVGETDR